MRQLFFDFNDRELKLFRRLNTPRKIQDFINSVPVNFEPNGDSCLSPREVIKQNRAHCVEGALLAATVLWFHGSRPQLMDIRSNRKDVDHVVALFKKNGYWGAISKTNHAVLRFREPVYKTPRELALSFFHEYFDDTGKKNMREFSEPFDLSKIKDRSWMTSKDNLWNLVRALDESRHYKILNKKQIANLRLADAIEIKAGKITEY